MPDQTPATTEFSGSRAAGTLLRRWWIILPLGIVGAVAGFLLSDAGQRQFAAEQQFIVTGSVVNPLVVEVSPANDPARLVQTQVDLMGSEPVADAAERKLGEEPEALSVSTSGQSNLFSATVTGTSRADAEASLDAYVAAYRGALRDQGSERTDDARAVLDERIDQLNTQIDETDGESAASSDQRTGLIDERTETQAILNQVDAADAIGTILVEPVAELVVTEVEPARRTSLAAGAAVGLAIGAAIALMVANRSRRRSSAD